MSREEMNLYSKLKMRGKLHNSHRDMFNSSKSQTKKQNLTHTTKISSEISLFLDDLEKNQRNVKNSIVSSLLKIEKMI